MKDWNIRDGELLHLPCEKQWISIPDEEGHWMCLYCETRAPEEIAFIAELANCRTFPILTWREMVKSFREDGVMWQRDE